MAALGGLLRPAVRTLGAIGGRSALMAGAAAVSFGAAAGVAAVGAGYALNRAANMLGGGHAFERTTHEVGGLHIPGIPKATRGLERSLGLGALMLGAAQGARQAAGGAWDVNHAISTGMMEVERPHFLGATGSLTIASSRRRSAGPEEKGPDYSRMAALYGDDVFHLMRAMTGR